MIVLAESNFVLEIALQQEQNESAESILDLAEQKKIGLVVPACSLFEPYETLGRRRGDRKALSRQLHRELQSLGRSRGFAEMRETSAGVAKALDASTEVEAEALEQVIERLLKVATIPSLSMEIVRLGQAYQLVYGLSPQDSVVFASIHTSLEGLGDDQKVFVNKNSKDFANDFIEDELKRYNCRLITSFEDALEYLTNELNRQNVTRVAEDGPIERL